MFEAKEIEYIKEFINERPDAFIYIGADSQRLKEKKSKIRYCSYCTLY